MKKILCKRPLQMLLAVICLLFSAPAFADLISFTSYDMYNTVAVDAFSYGGASNNDPAYYIPPVPVDDAAKNSPIHDYTGGTGTLRDGLKNEGVGSGLQPFMVNDDLSIVLNLGGLYHIDGIIIYGGVTSNATVATGAIGGLEVAYSNPGSYTTGRVQATPAPKTYNHVQDTFSDIPFLWFGFLQVFNTDVIDLAAFDITADTLTLDQFTIDPYLLAQSPNLELFSVAEIEVYGTLIETDQEVPVPEPGTFLLLGLGLCCLAFIGRKNLQGRA